jgi:hypothetical protein
MPTNFYYIYALKDPRVSPARPFYIGKGTGSRAYDHLVKPDKTLKYKRIGDIIASGKTVTVPKSVVKVKINRPPCRF